MLLRRLVRSSVDAWFAEAKRASDASEHGRVVVVRTSSALNVRGGYRLRPESKVSTARSQSPRPRRSRPSPEPIYVRMRQRPGLEA